MEFATQAQPHSPTFAVQHPEPDASTPSRRVSFRLGIGIFFIPYIFAWFTLRKGYSTQARAVSLGWAGFLLVFNFINLTSGAPQPSVSSTPASKASSTANTAEIEMQKAANALANAANTAVPYPSQQPPNPKFIQKVDTCSSIESELSGVKSDEAGVERMLDATEDFGEQAGSPKKALYLNALKRKGELQTQRIALERKLKACGKK